MEKNVFLHIGLHRTGTSFLQAQIFPKLKNTYFVPVSNIYPELIKICEQEFFSFQVQPVREKILKELRPGNNLISFENLSGNPFYQYRFRSLIIDRLYTIFPDAKVMIGIRSQADLLCSLYKLYIAAGGIRRLKEILFSWERFQDRPQYGSLDIDSFCYHSYLKHVDKLFGRQNFNIYIFEELQQDKKTALSKILRFLGEDEMPQFSDVFVNKGYGKAQIACARVLNRLFRSSFNPGGFIPWQIRLPIIGEIKPRRLLQSELSFKIYHDGKIISDPEYQELVKFYEEDNRRIEKDFNLNLEQFKTYFLNGKESYV